MKKPLAVPVETTTSPAETWTTRTHQIAAFGSQQCRSKNTVHSAICTISGPPEQLVINLACTSKAEEHVSELMQYVNDTLLPQMEKALGVQFEVRNLQFAVTGKENLLTTPEHAAEADLPTHWLEHPFAAPSLTPTAGLNLETTNSGSEADASPADLSMA
ncbi:hypothetical protein [Glutamicibacter sp. NPDC090743]|uniref:hypothetical protein n=1 Tax=Glutamicibacter sp. NPDC090743 TaxID=3364001 RepID=UPI0037FCCB51